MLSRHNSFKPFRPPPPPFPFPLMTDQPINRGSLKTSDPLGRTPKLQSTNQINLLPVFLALICSHFRKRNYTGCCRVIRVKKNLSLLFEIMTDDNAHKKVWRICLSAPWILILPCSNLCRLCSFSVKSKWTHESCSNYHKHIILLDFNFSILCHTICLIS